MKQVLFMRKFRIFINYSFSISSIALLLASCEGKELKTGYIDINVINQEYSVAKNLKDRLNFIEDSLTHTLSKSANQLKLENEKIKSIKEKGKEPSQEELKGFYTASNNFKKEKEEKLQIMEDMTLYYRDLLNKKINKSVFKYGAENGFTYIFNPAGSGSFMYADSSLDVTLKVIEYLNKNEEK